MHKLHADVLTLREKVQNFRDDPNVAKTFSAQFSGFLNCALRTDLFHRTTDVASFGGRSRPEILNFSYLPTKHIPEGNMASENCSFQEKLNVKIYTSKGWCSYVSQGSVADSIVRKISRKKGQT